MTQERRWQGDEDDLEALRESIARVLENEADRLTLHAHIDGKNRLDRLLWDKAIELGWLAIGLPEQFGGLGFGPAGLDVLHRELGRRTAPGSFAATLSAAQALLEVAPADVCESWLPRLAAGECSLAVPALLDGDSTSRETWLLGAEDAAAALVPLDADHWGIVPILSADPVDVWDRTRSVIQAELGKPEAILPAAETRRALARHLSLALASDGIGGARAVTELTIAYMKERQQFGRVIASFQALKHRVADLMTAAVSGEEFVALAVEAAANDDEDADTWAALAKVRATESYQFVAKDCVQLHGGVGFTWEFDVHLYLKRAWLSEALVAPHNRLRDRAHDGFAAAFRAGRQPLELAL